MMTNPLADLSNILSSLTPGDWQRLLQRLAEESEATAQRIRYLLQPRAAVHDIARRIAAFRRRQYRQEYRVADILGDELNGIVTDIEQDVLPQDPIRALALTESLLDLDGQLMEYESDYGSLSRAFEEASLLWLKAAKIARDGGCLPSMDWSARLLEIYASDSYAVRRRLVEQVKRLLTDSECQRLNDRLALQTQQERERHESRRANHVDPDRAWSWRASAPQEPPPGPRTPSAELERARFHLDCGDIEQALSILLPLKTRQEFSDPESTLDLLDRAYGQLGDTAKRVGVRRERFWIKPDLASYRRLAKLIDGPELKSLREEIALKPPACDPVTYARVLLAADLPLLAQSLMIAHAKTLEIEGPTHRLAALGQEATEFGVPLAATVVWRALINSILNHGKSRDYHLGTQMLAELQDLSADISDYRGLPTHREYEAELYSRHRLKSQFWRRVAVTK